VAQGKERLGCLERRSLAEEPIVRLILDGTVMRVRLDRKATAIVLLVVLGVRGTARRHTHLT
jgi:putative transposase